MTFKLFYNPEDGSGGGATTPASEPDPNAAGTPSTGAGADGADGGSQADAVKIAAERDRIEAERRQIQGERDRLKAELDALKAPKTEKTTESPALSRDEFLSLLRREREMGAALPTLRDQFPMADEALFGRVDEYDTVEAFKAAVESSHAKFEARLEALGVIPKTELDALRQKYVDKFGDLGDTPPDQNGGTNTGLPTAKELAAMPMRQYDAFVAQHGEDVIRQILRSAQEGA